MFAGKATFMRILSGSQSIEGILTVEGNYRGNYRRGNRSDSIRSIESPFLETVFHRDISRHAIVKLDAKR